VGLARWRTLVLAAAVALACVSGAGAAPPLEGAGLVMALRDGGYVVYFRHAATDFSQEDTDKSAGLTNCAKQRNLDPQGRGEARAIGRAFRALQVPVGQVLASRYCRTKETAMLAFGRARPTWDLTGLPQAANAREETRRVAALRRLLGTKPRNGTNTVLVAHLFNIQAAAKLDLAEGEAAVFRPLGDGRFSLVARVSPAEWTRLARRWGGGALLTQVKEYPLPEGTGPHDVAPAADGGVWFTAQATGELGWLDPRTGSLRHIALGEGSSPHGVIVGPDGAPWVTDSGLNAIVRVDPQTRKVDVYPLPAVTGYANLNTATFDRDGMLWFTGQSGVYGRLDPGTGEVEIYRAPLGAGPYGITTTPDGAVYYASLAGSYVGRIDVGTGRATVLRPPTREQGARRVWSDSKGRIWFTEWNAGRLGVYDPAAGTWHEWRLPGADPKPYAVYVDEDDGVWVSDFGSNDLVHLDPATDRFTRIRLPTPSAEVRQLAGRKGEVWGAESGADKLVVVRFR
jgi:virginiamycin B lyase